MKSKHFRYPGPQPFSSDQQEIFFGRESDVEKLYDLIQLEKLVVLFAQSGLGKSSLINAGLIPKVNAAAEIDIHKWRLGAYEEGGDDLIEKISSQLKSEDEESPILQQAFGDKQLLWRHFKNRQLTAGKDEFLIIIDQFEELFTYPEEQIFTFKKTLAEFIYTEIPSELRDELEKYYNQNTNALASEELDQIHRPFKIRLLFAIRSDRLSLLDNLSDFIPAILKVRYELKPLDIVEAEEAILNPAFLKSDLFVSPTFDYTDEAIEYILSFLSSNNRKSIESFQLQYLCQDIEKKVINQKLKRVELHHLDQQLDLIFKNYYDNQLSLLSNEADRKAARILLEETLIFEEEERRLNIYEGQIYQLYGFSPELLRQLCDLHLLRAEPSLKGGYTYEIPHDTLVSPILLAKQKRKKTEEEEAERQRKLLHKQELAKLEEAARIANKKKVRARLYALFATLISIAAIIGFTLARHNAQKAKVAEMEAIAARAKAESLSDSLAVKLIEYVQLSYEQYMSEAALAEQRLDFAEAINVCEQALGLDIELLMDKGQRARDKIDELEDLQLKYADFIRLVNAGNQLLADGKAQNYYPALMKFRQASMIAINDNLRKSIDNRITELALQIEDEFDRRLSRANYYLQLGNGDDACSEIKIALSLKPTQKAALDFKQKNCTN